MSVPKCDGSEKRPDRKMEESKGKGPKSELTQKSAIRQFDRVNDE